MLESPHICIYIYIHTYIIAAWNNIFCWFNPNFKISSLLLKTPMIKTLSLRPPSFCRAARVAYHAPRPKPTARPVAAARAESPDDDAMAIADGFCWCGPELKQPIKSWSGLEVIPIPIHPLEWELCFFFAGDVVSQQFNTVKVEDIKRE